MSSETGSLCLALVQKIVDLWSASKSDSLIDYTRVARVEPIVLIDADCMYLECLSDVQQSLLSIFAGYYLQAIAVSTTVGKVNVMHHLDRLNPNRNVSDSAANTMGWLLAAESYAHRLPTPNNQLAMEAEQNDVNNARSEMALGRDTMGALKELANLSVGKMLSVEITDGAHKATIPVSVRLMASAIPSTSLIHILSLSNKDNSVKERYHGWKSGRLEFIKDLVFCQDLIDAHRKNLMADKDNIYSNLIKRQRNNQLSTIVSGNPSVATASNIVVMSNDTVAQLELRLDGRMSDFKTREKVFKDTGIMLLAVIDKHWDRVSFYSRGINGHTEVGVRDLKSSNKGQGADVSEILKAYQMASSPSL